VRVSAVTFSLIVLAVVAAPARGQQALLTRDSKRDCATCHLDWVDSFERPGAVLLIDRPARPQAAVEEMCRGCHDGSVGDSRREVWLEHGHRVNEKPTDRIKVPSNMPLEDGKMVCRTCHTAHTVPTAGDLSKIVFLRAAKEGGLCQQCHVDRAYGAEHTSHPLAKLPFELPAELAAAHARTDMVDRTKMACQTCHTTHGARQDHLLVMGTNSGQLCVACHEKLRPTEWRADAPREHPQNPPLTTDGQRRAIAEMGTRMGPGDTLTCFSCHKMHSAKTGKYMLAETLEESRLCVRCHEDRTGVVASAHDLRTNKPAEKNRLGQTVAESGPCGACHSFHQYAREPKPRREDPSGRCGTCHAAGDDGGGKGLAFGHPVEVAAAKVPGGTGLKVSPHAGDPGKASLTCETCHDPHGGAAGAGRFLRKPADALCGTCHAQPSASLAGKHDFTAQLDLKNARGKSSGEVGRCGFCHAVHAPEGPVLGVATAGTPNGADEVCTQCHREGGLAARAPVKAFGHPTGAKVRPAKAVMGDLPLFDERGKVVAGGFVACGSCHDPHGDSAKSAGLLRVGGTVSKLCVECHAENAAMAGGPHDVRGKKAFPVEVPVGDLCTSCHWPHSDDVVRQGFTFVPAAGMARENGACVACHANQAWSAEEEPKVGRAIHPTTVPTNHAAVAAGLPLPGGGKEMGCGTCHDPHAKAGTPAMARVGEGGTTNSLCVRCHAAAEPLGRSMHAADVMEAGKMSAGGQACAPCHAVHAVGGSRRPLLWAGKANGWDVWDPEQRCLTCHAPVAGSKRILVQHPAEPVATLPWSTTRPASPATAEVRCGTCHVTHGEPAARVEADVSVRRAGRPMLRAGAARQCAYCHGASAPQLWLYWHEPAKRARVALPAPVRTR
jgi:predicted CXXCH cytochrome family protein